MTVSDKRKAPFPWFGGKRDAAPHIWQALGDPPHYVEPFAGTLAVLLNRPHEANRTYYSETVNDADGLLVNFWRAVQLSPQAVAEHASWPVTEADKIARSCAVLDAGRRLDLERLLGDPLWHDPQLAGWWVWCVCVTIGAFGAGGPWWPDTDGRIRKWGRDEPRPGVGVWRNVPHLGNNGKGVNKPQLREPGVSRGLPHLGNDGKGVNKPQLREPGVSRDLPHLGNDGQGVNKPQLREPGVSRDLPHLGNDGQGVNHPGTKEPGVSRDLPHLGDDGQGVNNAGVREPGVLPAFPITDHPEYHPMVMPDLRVWLGYLSARLRHVRIINGDWRRTVGTGAAITLPVRQGKGPCGVLLDPPYGAGHDVYRDGHGNTDTRDLAAEAAQWAVGVGDDPRWRIVACGYDGDTAHALYTAAGWRIIDWHRAGFLTKGYGDSSHRERLYLSPHCLGEPDDPQGGLW